MACFNVYRDSDDNWEFFSKSTHTARKQHICCECKGAIEPGQKYEDAVGKGEGIFQRYKTCLACLEIRKRFFRSWIYGCIFDDFFEGIDGLTPTDMDGLSPQAVGKIDKVLDWS